MRTPRGDYLARNRNAAHWRAVVVKCMRAAGHPYSFIGELFDISAERARQICARPLPSAQLAIPLSHETPAP